MGKKTQFLLEIEQQPEALRRVVQYYQKEGMSVLKQAVNLIRYERGRRIVFTGMGTSLYAGTIVYSQLSNYGTSLPVMIEAGELFNYNLCGIRLTDTVIAISQSGESIETRKVVEKLAEDKQRIVAITNNEKSRIANLATLNLPILAGNEASISNKSYTNTLAVLLLLANEIIKKKRDALIYDLLHCADTMDEFLMKRRGEIDEAAKFLHKADYLYFISRGASMTAAKQAALTWMEGVHIPAVAISGASFRHGPYELARPGFQAVFYISTDGAGFLVEKMAKEITEFGARVLVFSEKKTSPNKNLFVINVEPGNDYLLPFACAIAQELLLSKMAADRGWSAGIFERGSKVTDKE